MNNIFSRSTSFGDEELANKIKYDTQAFSTLYERYKDKIYNYVYTFLNFDEESSINVLSDTFIRIFEYCKTNKIDNFNALIYRTAHNLAVSHIERNKSDMFLQEDSFLNIVDQEDIKIKDKIDQKYKKEIVSFLLERLESKYREVIYLYFFEELSYDDIAGKLGTNKNTIGTLVHRAKEKISALIEKHGLSSIF